MVHFCRQWLSLPGDREQLIRNAGSGLSILADRDQRELGISERPQKYFTTGRRLKKYFPKSKTIKIAS